jgi:uncharacterized protein (TIGR02145 family)
MASKTSAKKTETPKKTSAKKVVNPKKTGTAKKTTAKKVVSPKKVESAKLTTKKTEAAKTTPAKKVIILKKAEPAKTTTSKVVTSKETTSFEEVTIGKQVWMAKNLISLNFSNGEPIKLAKSVSEWKKLNEKGIPACCYYEGDDAVKDNKTLLYNWFAVNDKRGLAPKGWKVPSVADWHELYSFAGGDKKGVRKLKSKEVWDGSPFLVKNSFGTNESGFNLLPTGSRDHFSGNFYSAKTAARLWTSNPAQTKSAYFVDINHENKYNTTFGYKQLGYAVRCIKK